MSQPSISIDTCSINYFCEDQVYIGYLATPSSLKTPTPGIAVVPEWWGLNQYIKSRCDQLARSGYIAMGIDMYGEGKCFDSPQDAASGMTSITSDKKKWLKIFASGITTLRKQRQINQQRIAAIGYCFGGETVMYGALAGLDLNAVASFHGAFYIPSTPPQLNVTTKFLICHGGADALVAAQDALEFNAHLESIHAEYEYICYETAEHGFTNRQADENARRFGLPLGYNESADESSWQSLQQFLGRHL